MCVIVAAVAELHATTRHTHACATVAAVTDRVDATTRHTRVCNSCSRDRYSSMQQWDTDTCATVQAVTDRAASNNETHTRDVLYLWLYVCHVCVYVSVCQLWQWNEVLYLWLCVCDVFVCVCLCHLSVGMSVYMSVMLKSGWYQTVVVCSDDSARYCMCWCWRVSFITAWRNSLSAAVVVVRRDYQSIYMSVRLFCLVYCML